MALEWENLPVPAVRPPYPEWPDHWKDLIYSSRSPIRRNNGEMEHPECFLTLNRRIQGFRHHLL